MEIKKTNTIKSSIKTHDHPYLKDAWIPNYDEYSPSIPASFPPTPVIAKYSPIILDYRYTGDNLVMTANATGEKHSSPTVWNRNVSNIHNILLLPLA